MLFLPADIADVVLVEPAVFADSRGDFMETWRADRFASAGIDVPFVQDNQSRSCRGTLRGLHYQIDRPQGKLVRCVEGEIFDVAVDMRRSSPTFGRWVGYTLSGRAPRMLWVPPGFAHGFYVTSQQAVVAYKCTEYYAPALERTLRWNDPAVAISWPLGDAAPLLSPKDAAAPTLETAVCFV